MKPFTMGSYVIRPYSYITPMTFVRHVHYWIVYRTFVANTILEQINIWIHYAVRAYHGRWSGEIDHIFIVISESTVVGLGHTISTFVCLSPTHQPPTYNSCHNRMYINPNLICPEVDGLPYDYILHGLSS